MFTRALIVLLLVLNLGIALWWWLAPAPTTPPAPAQLADVPLLRLPGEAQSAMPGAIAPPAAEVPPAAVVGASTQPSVADGSVTASEPAQVASVEGAGAPSVEMASTPPAVAASGTGSGTCYAFGPLSQAPTQAVLARYAHGPVQRQPRPDDLPAPRGWRVVMPPLPDADAAVAMQQRLRDAGFNDQLLVRNPPEPLTIALGLFGTREAAERHRAALAAAGFQAQLHPSGNDIRPALAFELRAGVDADAARVGLHALRVQALDCASLR